MKKVLVVLVLLVLAFCGFVLTRPSEYTVERKATFDAPPAVVYGMLSDFHHWNDWSPWSKRDPNMKSIYSGAASGNGAAFAWAGNDKVGEGKMTITEVKPNERIAIDLEFLKPFESKNETVFTLAPQGDKTELTWKMNGKANFIFKAMSIFKSPDEMMGPDFEQGLANLKPLVESEAKAQAEAAAKAAEAAKAEEAAKAAAEGADGGTAEAAAAPGEGAAPPPAPNAKAAAPSSAQGAAPAK